eukprot:4896055-Pleurochrysis_carterae.AAC.4
MGARVRGGARMQRGRRRHLLGSAARNGGTASTASPGRAAAAHDISALPAVAAKHAGAAVIRAHLVFLTRSAVVN